MNFRFDRAAEERFLNKPVILDVARLIVDSAKSRFSDRHYKKLGISQKYTWTPTEKFFAAAYVDSAGGHEIRLSYGSAIEIYRDAFVFPETCKRVLVDPAFDPIFGLLSYGNARSDVLPVGLEPTDAKITMIYLVSTWLYLHEQSHLLQRHGAIATGRGATELLSHDGDIVDGETDGVQPPTGEHSALRHAFELSADNEATTMLLMDGNVEGLSLADLWCFAGGLMCLFQRFHGARTAFFDELPTGSHPHPGLRMRMVIRKIEQLFSMPEFARRAPWAQGPEHVRAVMDHAVYAAYVYWHLRYLGLDARSPMLEAVSMPRVVPPTYQHALFGIWKEIRPEVVRGHLGYGEPMVLFLKDPRAVG